MPSKERGREKEDCKVCTCMPDCRAKRSAKFGLGSKCCISEPWAAIKACPTQCPIPKTESQLGAPLSLRARNKGWRRGRGGNVLSRSRELISCCGGRGGGGGEGEDEKKDEDEGDFPHSFPFYFLQQSALLFPPLLSHETSVLLLPHVPCRCFSAVI